MAARNYEGSWLQWLGEHQIAVAICGGTLAQTATCAFLYIHYSLVRRFPNHHPAQAIYENIHKHYADLQNVGCVAFYLGVDAIVLSLMPQLKDFMGAMNFFVGVLCISCFVAFGFGHVSPHACRLIHGLPMMEVTEFRADSVLLDFTVPISELCFKAIAQISCFVIYIFGLYRIFVYSSHEISIMYWAISVVAVQFYMFNADPTTSRRCYISSGHWVEAMLSHIRGYRCFVKFGPGEWICPSRPSMILRASLHFLINGLGFLLIWLTVPVLVAVADSPLDYIMNLFAVTFLTQLDDVDEEKKFLLRFSVIGCNDAFNTYTGLTQPGEEIPMVEMPSMSVDDRGVTKMETMSRIRALELENSDLKHRLALLEANFTSIHRNLHELAKANRGLARNSPPGSARGQSEDKPWISKDQYWMATDLKD